MGIFLGPPSTLLGQLRFVDLFEPWGIRGPRALLVLFFFINFDSCFFTTAAPGPVGTGDTKKVDENWANPTN